MMEYEFEIYAVNERRQSEADIEAYNDGWTFLI